MVAKHNMKSPQKGSYPPLPQRLPEERAILIQEVPQQKGKANRFYLNALSMICGSSVLTNALHVRSYESLI